MKLKSFEQKKNPFFVIYFYGLSTSEGKFLRLKLRIQCALLIQINACSDGDILTYCSLLSSFFPPLIRTFNRFQIHTI